MNVSLLKLGVNAYQKILICDLLCTENEANLFHSPRHIDHYSAKQVLLGASLCFLPLGTPLLAKDDARPMGMLDTSSIQRLCNLEASQKLLRIQE